VCDASTMVAGWVDEAGGTLRLVRGGVTPRAGVGEDEEVVVVGWAIGPAAVRLISSAWWKRMPEPIQSEKHIHQSRHDARLTHCETSDHCTCSHAGLLGSPEIDETKRGANFFEMPSIHSETKICL
jgi:hypothetical protein